LGDLTQYFDNDEFECGCGCGFDAIDWTLVNLLNTARRHLKRPIIIKSGCRCSEHNKKEGGKPNSSHLSALAADIKAKNSRYRFLLLEELFKLGFNRIGIAKTFIHVDIDPTKPKEVAFLY